MVVGCVRILMRLIFTRRTFCINNPCSCSDDEEDADYLMILLISGVKLLL